MSNFTLKSIQNVSPEFLTVFMKSIKYILWNIFKNFISDFDLWRKKTKDSVETLNELEGDFSAALFHRSRIILS